VYSCTEDCQVFTSMVIWANVCMRTHTHTHILRMIARKSYETMVDVCFHDVNHPRLWPPATRRCIRSRSCNMVAPFHIRECMRACVQLTCWNVSAEESAWSENVGKQPSKRLAMNSDEDSLATGGTGIKVCILCTRTACDNHLSFLLFYLFIWRVCAKILGMCFWILRTVCVYVCLCDCPVFVRAWMSLSVRVRTCACARVYVIIHA
jgi:hypothetical protein